MVDQLQLKQLQAQTTDSETLNIKAHNILYIPHTDLRLGHTARSIRPTKRRMEFDAAATRNVRRRAKKRF